MIFCNCFIRRLRRCRLVRRSKAFDDHLIHVILSFYSSKGPTCEIFNCSDFIHDFYTIKSLWVGDFRINIKIVLQNIQGFIQGSKVPYAQAQSNFKDKFFGQMTNVPLGSFCDHLLGSIKIFLNCCLLRYCSGREKILHANCT